MKQCAYIVLVILLSLSIVAPSILSVCSDHYDIEISKDLGEDDTHKEIEKEFESEDAFFEIFITPKLATLEDIKFYHDTYCLSESLFMAKIYLPPPQFIA